MGLLQPLQSTVQTGANTAQDITQRLQQFGSEQLQNLQQQGGAFLQPLQQPVQQVQEVTQRLQDFGAQQLQALQPLNRPLVQQMQSFDEQQPQQQGPADAQTMAAYIRQAAAQRGIDPETAVKVANSEGLNTYVGDSGSSFGPFQLHYGGVASGGNAVSGLGDTFTKRTGLDARDPNTWRQQVDFALDTAKQTGWGPWHGAAAAGIGDREGLDGQPVAGGIQGVIEGAKQAVGSALGLGQQSQFGDPQLSAAEAYAACGPAAAIRFAQRYGRNPTLREAVDIARTVGWDTNGGMNGVANQKRLMDEIGVPTRVVGVNWEAYAREASTGNPVMISTPGHYFTADSYNPQTGQFHVGRSGLDLRGGKEWMTREEMEARMGASNGALFADNPTVAAPSLAQPGAQTTAADQTQRGIRTLDAGAPDTSLARKPRYHGIMQPVADQDVLRGAKDALAGFTAPVGDLLGRIGELPGLSEADRAARRQALEASPLGQLYGSDVRRAILPNILEPNHPINVMAELQQKYGALPREEQMTPEDRARWRDAQLFVGGMAGTFGPVGRAAAGVGGAHLPEVSPRPPEPPTTRMYHGTGAGFQTPEPGRFDSNGLFGPGYYLTSEPRVAGGSVLGETRPVTELQQSLIDRGLLSPENARSQAGTVLQPGYAQEQATRFTEAGSEQLAELERRIDKAREVLAGNPSPELRSYVEQDLSDALARYEQLAPKSGPNVRAVDVPQDLNLLNAERYVDPADLQEIRAVLEQSSPAHVVARRLDIFDRVIGQAFEGRPTGERVFDALNRAFGNTGESKEAVNRVLADAGFDGITYAGGKRIPMTDEAGRALEHQATVVFPESLSKVRNAISMRQGGQVNPLLAARLGGAAVGGYLGNQSAPEDAGPLERGARIAGGAALGAGLGSTAGLAATGPLEQRILKNLRSSGLVAGAPRAARVRGPIAEGVDVTKQMILSNPATHIANIIGNTIELGRQPIAMTIGGRGDDALAGLISLGRGLPEAAGNAASALRGNQVATLASGASAIPARAPIFRLLSASDAFTRTLAEYQGMAAEANRLLREAGMSASDAGAERYLVRHAADLHTAGARAGAQSVFGRVGSAATGRSVLDNVFKTYANAKEGLLNSPRLRDQAMGALMDFFVPFSGVPVQLLEIGLNRLPVAAQATGAVRAIRSLRAGNVAEAQRALGETGLETAVQLMIAKNVADGNITGPDDPDHPSSVNIGGNWVSMSEWGGYALPMQIMASFADGFEKGGRDLPAGTSVADVYGPRFAAAFNASLKPFQKGIPGENLLRLVSNIGQGGATAGALGLAQDAVNRVASPGAARFVENLMDPLARDVNRKGVESLWQGPMSNWPGLAQQLPAKIDPTTGEPLTKARSGAGTLVGVQQEVESPITIEANYLKKQGYDINAPKTYPDAVTIAGSEVKLKPDEQREVAKITGKMLGDFAVRLEPIQAARAAATTDAERRKIDDRAWRTMNAFFNASAAARIAAVTKVIGRQELQARIARGRQVGGRYVNEGTVSGSQIVPEVGQFLSSVGLSGLEQQQLATGTR